MFSFLNAIILHAFVFATSVRSYAQPTLQPEANSSTVSLTPGIEATITSPTGNDITSNFQILLYEPPEDVVSNLTDRQVAPSRPLNFCQSPEQQTFYSSHCNYDPYHARPKSLQNYIIYCSESRQTPRASHTRILTQYGRCTDDEICVDGVRGLDRNRRGTVAKCVARSIFKPILRKHTIEDELALRRQLGSIMAVALLAQTDGTTPLSASKLELDAGVAEGEGEGVQSVQSCNDCFELATSKLGEGTDFLKTQATLGAVGAVTAGIMYLAVLSG